MAPKRSAPPPPPPPPAASSEETASGSGSDESEDEEEIAHSPPPDAPKNTAPPPQKGQESETSEEDEDEEEEEEEEEEDDDKANHKTLPSTTKNPPPPPPNREESETDGEEEEEDTDDEVPLPKPAPNPETDGKGSKPSSSGEDKKPGAPFQRTWSTDDEVRILEALAAHLREHGTLPQPDALLAALADSLDNSGYNLALLQGKVKSLKRRYSLAAKKGELPSKDHDRRLFDLSKIIWGAAATPNGGATREFSEMCKLYPYFAEEVKALEKSHPGLFKREFAMIDDDKARALDVKIKKQRLQQMKLELRRYDLTKEVTRTLMDLVD